LIYPIVFVKVINFSEENPKASSDVLQNNECEQQCDHPLEPCPYFQNVGDVLHELILNPNYLY
jgi:hypothetical protein